MMCRGLLLLFCWAFAPSSAQSKADDELYILIDSAQIYTCRSVKSYAVEMRLEDIEIRDESGRNVSFIRAPGNYSVHFRKLRVLKPLRHLVGEMSILLQVPLFEGPAGISFDIPYQAVPENVNGRKTCDEDSGLVNVAGTPYCRYCNLCEVTERLESDLRKDRLLGLPTGYREGSRASCGRLDKALYEIRRQIRVPSKSELEKEAEEANIRDDQLENRLKKGKGRMLVRMNLLDSPRRPVGRAAAFRLDPLCKCCDGANANLLPCKVFPFLYCQRQKCLDNHAKMCIPEDSPVVACYTTQFNYRLTDEWADVEAFLRQRGLPAESRIPRPASHTTPKPSLWRSVKTRRLTRPTPGPVAKRAPLAPASGHNGSTSQRSSTTARSSSTSAQSGSERSVCLAALGPTAAKFCRRMWNQSFCCAGCPGVCAQR